LHKQKTKAANVSKQADMKNKGTILTQQRETQNLVSTAQHITITSVIYTALSLAERNSSDDMTPQGHKEGKELMRVYW
jgi:hypothetical protein